MTTELEDKQERFCQEYIIDLNATQAAIRAGYSPKTARQIASQNLSKLNIQERISELKKDARERNDLTLDKLIQELSKIAFFKLSDVIGEDGELLPVNEWSESAKASISSLDILEIKDSSGNHIGFNKKLKPYNKLDAIEKLFKHLGGYRLDNKQKLPEAVRLQFVGNDDEFDDEFKDLSTE